MTDAIPAPGGPLAGLGRHLAAAGEHLTSALVLIPECQGAASEHATRLENLRDVLDRLAEALAIAPHPLLIRALAEAQRPAQEKP